MSIEQCRRYVHTERERARMCVASCIKGHAGPATHLCSMLLLDIDILDVVMRLEPAGEDVFDEKRKWKMVSKAWHKSVSVLLADPVWLRPYCDAATAFLAGLATVGDVRSVIAGMRSFRTFPHVHLRGCAALASVDDRDGLREATQNGDMVGVLTDVLDRHSGLPELEFKVLLLLTRICVLADIDTLDQAGGCSQLLLRILQTQ